MMGKLFLLLVAIASVEQMVTAHSVLQSIGDPADDITAWSTKDGTGGPCGRGSQTANVQMTVDEGSTVNVVWKVNAGDGVGTLSAKLDKAAGVDFDDTVSLNVPAEPLQNGGEFPFTFVVPEAKDCTGETPDGTTGVCNYQFRCAAWKSCVSIKVKEIPEPLPPPPPQPTCQVLPTLAFCSHLTGMLAIIQPGTTDQMIQEQDNVIGADAATNLNQIDIVRGGKDQACIDAAKQYLCQSSFNGCAEAGVENPPKLQSCRNTCTTFRNLCTIDATHLDTWPCTDNTVADVAGTCPLDTSVPDPVQRPSDEGVQSVGTRGYLVGWKAPADAGQQFGSVEKFVGDKITFDFTETVGETVWQFPTKAAYDACNMAEGELVAASDAGKYVFLITTPPNSYVWFASSKPSSCAAGMKIEFKVVAGGACTEAVNKACTALGRSPCSEASQSCGGCEDGSMQLLQSCTGEPADYGEPDIVPPGQDPEDGAGNIVPSIVALVAPLIALFAF